MKLLRYGEPGSEKPGMLDANGQLRDLSDIVADIDGSAVSPSGLAKLAAVDPSTLPLAHGAHRIGACVARPLNFVCIGLNYADHAAESGLKVPSEPVVFIKSLSAYCGPNDDVMIPRGSKKTDWEVELGVIIGSTARYVPENEAMAHVAGYCVINDVSEREFQTERGGTWDKGKGCDTFGPTGPWLVTRDEVADPQNLDMWLDVDGERMQHGSTKTMVFGVAKLVSYVSHFITLHPGDIISTGTPPGVGMGKKPQPIYLKAGQTIRLGIQGLGEQQQRVVQA
jgi:2-keto-4-pentenoate hydratase/2-oxohepta-3-ene-1,7-dioic acid hydratase in catechol pathway